VVEFAGMGPGPFAAMLLADAGADVVRIERRGAVAARGPLARGRTIVHLDLKADEDLAEAWSLISAADVLTEGFRPGVMERLGLGPEPCLARNPRLVYGRMTGWGRTGPLADTAGHDINYLAVTGALDTIVGRDGTPVPPLNLVADLGGGGMLLVFGILAALHERHTSGRGQVVDAAMVDGVSLLMAGVWGRLAEGRWAAPPGGNYLDGGAPFYAVYPTSDGRFMAVGCLEPSFYAKLVEGLGLNPADLPEQWEQARWPELRARIAERFATRTRDEWTAIFDGTDACVTPVRTLSEAPHDPHLVARGTLLQRDGNVYPAAAPRLSRTPLCACPD
jgi:alpha-methylacyl-CoA racemase